MDPGRSDKVWMQPKGKMCIAQLEERPWECRGKEGRKGEGGTLLILVRL